MKTFETQIFQAITLNSSELIFTICNQNYINITNQYYILNINIIKEYLSKHL